MNVTVQSYPIGRRAADIAGSVEAAIREGSTRPGDRLPTVRELARRNHISPATVAAAYRELRARGLVHGTGRSGTTVAPRPPLLGRIRIQLGEGMRDLASGNPDPDLLPSWDGALEMVHRRSLQYGVSIVDPDLLDLATARLGADGLDPSHLTVVSGALDGLERILSAHLRAGDAVAVEDPVYPAFLDLIRAMGLRPVAVRVDDRGLLPAELERALGAGIRAVVLTPRSQNPYGAALDPERVAELRRLLEGRREVLVVEDDHAEALGGGRVVGLAGPEAPAWAVVRSVSKSLGPDLRLAVVCGDERTISRVEGRLGVGAGWVSHVLQRIVVGLWSRPDIDDVLSRAAATYRRRRQALLGALAARDVVAHGATGFNVWVPVEAEAPALAELAAAGYGVLPGERFRLTSGPALRITTATLEPSEAGRVADAVAVARRIGTARLA